MQVAVIAWKRLKETYQEGWISLKDLNILDNYEIVTSVGFIVNESDSSITIASQQNMDCMVNGLLTIPLGTIVNKVLIDYLPCMNDVTLSNPFDADVRIVTEKESLAYAVEHMKELPEEFEGVNVSDFTADYNELSQKQLAEKYDVSLTVVQALINALVKFGKVERHPVGNWKTRKQHIEAKPYKTKIDMLIDKYKEISEISSSMTQKELAGKYGVSAYTMATALQRMNLNTRGRA